MCDQGDKLWSFIRQEFNNNSIGCEASPQAINDAFGPLLCPLDYGPIRVAIDNDKVVIASIVEIICTDALWSYILYLKHSPDYIDSKCIWVHGSNFQSSSVFFCVEIPFLAFLALHR